MFLGDRFRNFRTFLLCKQPNGDFSCFFFCLDIVAIINSASLLILNVKLKKEANMDKKNSLQDYLKKLRLSKGYSQEFVAENLNITRQTYSHYETGRIVPPINSLYNLARLYGEPVENLLELAVTYRIGDEYVPSAFHIDIDVVDDLTGYRAFIESEKYKKACKSLNQEERLLLYYYSCLDLRDRKDILSFMKIKAANHESEEERD